MMVPDQLKMKNMILISIQCVLNVYPMCIQALAANIYHFSETKDYNNGGIDQLKVNHMILISIQCVFRLLELIHLI